MPSAQETAKRASAQLLRAQGREYGVEVAVAREAPPTDVTRAYRALARRAHPDKSGGCKDDFQKLTAAHNAATPGETLAQLKRRMGRVQGHINSAAFQAPGGGGGMVALALSLHARCTEVSRTQGERLRA